MAAKTLTWHFEGSLAQHRIGTGRGPAYLLDASYAPVQVLLYAGTATHADEVVIDIKADGVTIFQHQPNLVVKLARSVSKDVKLPRLPKGTLITLDLVSIGSGAEDLTVQLDLI